MCFQILVNGIHIYDCDLIQYEKIHFIANFIEKKLYLNNFQINNMYLSYLIFPFFQLNAYTNLNEEKIRQAGLVLGFSNGDFISSELLHPRTFDAIPVFFSGQPLLQGTFKTVQFLLALPDLFFKETIWKHLGW
ncbi:hypothetical protein ACJX0J_030495, partial [Zea mays]